MGYVRNATSRIESLEFLDPAFERVRSLTQRVIPAGPIQDFISGKFAGHPLHPGLTDLPIGAWTTSMLLDFVGGRRARSASQLSVGFGVLSAIPTAISGASDGSYTSGRVSRVVTVHALANSAATMLYGGSWLARRRGHHGPGVALGLLGATAATIGGMLGGEIVYTTGTGVNRTAFEELPSDWTAPEPGAEPPVHSATLVRVDGVDVLLAREVDGTLRALADHCTHRGGPLHEGQVENGCVTCPWHASRFRLADGEPVVGPAVTAQPVYDVQLGDDGLKFRAASPVPPRS